MAGCLPSHTTIPILMPLDSEKLDTDHLICSSVHVCELKIGILFNVSCLRKSAFSVYLCHRFVEYGILGSLLSSESGRILPHCPLVLIKCVFVLLESSLSSFFF